MCEQVIQFCSGSTKPLLFAGSALTALLAIGIGWTGCANQAFYRELDPLVAQQDGSLKLAYYLQLAAAVYLLALTLLTCFAAHCDQKHTIRGLAVVTSINFVLVASAILILPRGPTLVGLFEGRLTQAQQLYNFTDKFPVPPAPVNETTAAETTTGGLLAVGGGAGGSGNGMVMSILPQVEDQQAQDRQRIVRATLNTNNSTSGDNNQNNDAAAKLTPSEATKVWDQLQSNGQCCGFKNATLEWPADRIPKSCCAKPVEDPKTGQWVCKTIGQEHDKPCSCFIESSAMSSLILLALIALANLYLATVSGLSTYRTFHYNEASQNAYG